MADSPSYSVALVLLPPPHIAAIVDALRCANDKAWPRWSPHVTVLFPFGSVSDLSSITDTLRAALATFEPFHIKLDTVGKFSQRSYQTVYLGTSNPGPVQALWKAVVEATSYPAGKKGYTPHMTLGQTARNSEAIAFLTDKGSKLIKRHDFSWRVDSVALLQKDESQGGKMVVYAQIPLGSSVDTIAREYVLSGPPTYYFDGRNWSPRKPTVREAPITSLTVATYNILHDPAFPFTPRFPHVLDAILESNADIICLQEVSDQSLTLILQNDQIRREWPWCTRHDQSVLESERNIVLLSRKAFGFEWTRLELGGKHKACVVARLWHQGESNPDKSIVVAGVHLTAGRSPEILQAKRDEIAKLLSYLQEHYAEDDWIVIGDVNCPSNEDLLPSDADIVDIWAETVETDIATYDPTTNPLAAVTARNCRTPERYDRIFIKKGSRSSVMHDVSGLFGRPRNDGAVASDHWGLRATLQFNDTPPDPSATMADPASKTHAQNPAQFLLPTTFTDSQLKELCINKGFCPTDAQNRVFQNALDAFRDFVASISSSARPFTSVSSDDAGMAVPATGVRLVVALVGSFAMGYHTSSSDIDCVVVGNITPHTFWNVIRLKIRTAKFPQHIKLRRFVKDAIVQMMELDVGTVKVDLQYCPAPNLIECWEDLPNIPRSSPLFSLPATALRTLNAHRDTLSLLKALPSLDTFRLAHRALKLFMYQRGIAGARFGFLGGFHIAFLLARICLQAPPTATAAQLVRIFFNIYAHWDWERDIVTVPIPDTELAEVGYRRSKREPMVVLSVARPQVNMTINANPNSVAVMKSVFLGAHHACNKGLPWSVICGDIEGEFLAPFERFVRDQKAFIKIEVSYWGSSCMKGRAWIGWLESRFVSLLVQLHESVPTIRAHLWPSRLADSSTTDDRTLNGFYLIGLSSLTDTSGSDVEKQSVRTGDSEFKAAMLGTLRTFEYELRSNTRFYDQNEMFVCVTNTAAAQLPSSLVLDAFQWPDGGYDDEEGDEDDEDEDEDEDEGLMGEDSHQGGFRNGADTWRPTLETTQKKRQTPHVPAAKLRTSSDIYNRLMWDPSLSKEDFVIGYEDRFKGTKEVPLTAWKREVEDESFIPFHRVVHFRRKSDNVKVWDRKTKTDLVFGSGVKVS